MSTAFVLGNGRSRLNVDPNKLIGKGKIFGCNALYREFKPDFLIAVDAPMLSEIVESGYYKENQVWTSQRNQNKFKQINIIVPSRGWSSGPTALDFACKLNFRTIYIMGFDYTGIKNRFNNVYSDSKNYKKSSDTATYYGNWLKQTEQVIRENGKVKFVRLYQQGITLVPKELERYKNLTHMTYIQFNELLQQDKV